MNLSWPIHCHIELNYWNFQFLSQKQLSNDDSTCFNLLSGSYFSAMGYMVRPVNSIEHVSIAVSLLQWNEFLSQKHVPRYFTVNKAFYKSVIGGASRRQEDKSIPRISSISERTNGCPPWQKRANIPWRYWCIRGSALVSAAGRLSTQQCWHNQISRGADKPRILSPCVVPFLPPWAIGSWAHWASTGNTGKEYSFTEDITMSTLLLTSFVVDIIWWGFTWDKAAFVPCPSWEGGREGPARERGR